MLRRRLTVGEGILLVEPFASRAGTAIHMLFMLFPIAVIWINTEFIVVDKTLAKPWLLAYVPRIPAQYTLEASPELLERIPVGTQLEFQR